MKIKKLIVPSLLFTILITSCNSNKNQITFYFPCNKDNDYNSICYYNDSYFETPSIKYNSSLSTTSLAFAMSAFASNVEKENVEYRYRNADYFLKSYNFTNIDVNDDYKKKSSKDTFGVVFGSKKINDYTLIALGTRGGNYEMEWASNFTLGDRSNYKGHQGFYNSSTILLNGLENYISKYNIEGKIKLWSVGYSRGGAVNNISIGRIDQKINKNEIIFNEKISLKKEDIYCYCFEPPMGASFLEEISPKNEIYSNIFNIVNPNDLVPKIAPKEFHFTRYGIDYYLPDKIRNINYNSLIDNVISNYKKMSDYSILGDYSIDDFTLSSLSKGKENENKISYIYNNKFNYTLGLFNEKLLTYFVEDAIYTLDNYVENFQEGLRNIFEILYKDGNFKSSAMTIGTYFVKYLIGSSDVDLLINTLLNDPLQFCKDFTVLLNTVLKDLDISIETETLYDAIKNLLFAFAKVCIAHLDVFFTLLNTSNIKSVALAHYPEITLSHLMNQDLNYVSKLNTYNSDGSYYYLNVDGLTSASSIEIFNESNELVFKLNNGYIDTSVLNLTCGNQSVNNFYAYIPVEASYNIKINNVSSYSLSYFDQRYENLIEYKNEKNIDTQGIDIITSTYPEKNN